MSPDQVTSSSRIVLNYILISDDLRDGFAAAQRRRWHRWCVPLVAVAALIGLAIGSVRSAVWELSTSALAVVAVASLVVVVVIVGLGLLLQRLLFTLTCRWQVQLILRGNPWLAQPIQATATESGLHLRNATGDSTTDWSHYPVYVETDQSFVLLASKRIGAMVLVLPKRGLGGADPAQLRALLAIHSRPCS